MKELMMKARSGVTLVELLVVILIVTILSVSMLPLLKPFVVEAQYAAEAIPVIGNLRTKIGLFQYDKGKLPALWDKDNTGGSAGTTPLLESWSPSTDGSTVSDSTSANIDLYVKSWVALSTAYTPFPTFAVVPERDTSADPKIGHIGFLCDINYQDLKGKRSRPNDYQYLVMKNGSDYVYFLGCFGDGNGLPKGTGYAVCEINLKNHKYVGTWKRYKPVSIPDAEDDIQLFFTSSTEHASGTESKDTYSCCVLTQDDFDNATDSSGTLDVISKLVEVGWEF